MPTEKSRHPSPLQRRILIVLAAMEKKSPDPTRTRDLEVMLKNAEDRPVYGNNLRASCRRMETEGWLRTLRASNLQLAVELTPFGREIAIPLLQAEQERLLAELRATEVKILPVAGVISEQKPAASIIDRPVVINGTNYLACRGDFVVRLTGSTCLQLWNSGGQITRIEGDPLQVAYWLQACHDNGIVIRVQVNESHSFEYEA